MKTTARKNEMTTDAALLADLRAAYGDTATTGDIYHNHPEARALLKTLPRVSRGLVSLVPNGAKVGLSVAAPAAPKETAEQLSARIHERFEVLELLADAIVAGNVCSMIVSGAAGVGKSYTLEKKVNEGVAKSKLRKVTTIKGSISAIGLFLTLWENNRKGDVVVLDDIDVFGDEETLNVLKSALDTNGRRNISWIKDSSFLRDRDIPNTFEYKGQIVFLTNANLQAVADKGGKMAPHVLALLSRSVFMDLGIHSPAEILVRIRQVLRESKMAEDLKLSPANVEQLLGWMESNAPKLRCVSLRTVIQMAGFMKTTNDWQKLARVTLLRTH